MTDESEKAKAMFGVEAIRAVVRDELKAQALTVGEQAAGLEEEINKALARRDEKILKEAQPEARAAAVSKRMNAVITLSAKVESGQISPETAKLALSAGGYEDDVVELVDALKAPPEFDPMAKLAEAEAKHGCEMALVVVYSRDSRGPMMTLAHLEDADMPAEVSLRAASEAIYQGLRKVAGLVEEGPRVGPDE